MRIIINKYVNFIKMKLTRSEISYLLSRRNEHDFLTSVQYPLSNAEIITDKKIINQFIKKTIGLKL